MSKINKQKNKVIAGSKTAVESKDNSEDLALEIIRRYLRASSERFEIELGMTLDQFNEYSEKFEKQRVISQQQLKESSDKFVLEMEKSREYIKTSSEKFIHNIEKSQEYYKPLIEDQRQAEKEKSIKKPVKTAAKLPGGFKAQDIAEEFDEKGFSFTEKSYNKEIRNPDNSVTNIDIVMENDNLVLAIQVKSKPSQSDIDDHLERVEILQRIARRRNDFREYRGAVAGTLSQKVREYAIEKGLYLVEKTGSELRLQNK